MSFCTKCGTPASEGDVFCSKCGAKITANVSPHPSPEAIKSNFVTNPDEAAKKVKDSTNWTEKVASIIPGYRGYQQKEKIRESDRLVREEVFRLLRLAVRDIDHTYGALVNKGDRLYDYTDKTKIRLDRLAERVRHSEYGYAGRLDPIKFGEEGLLSLVRFDYSLIEKGQQIASASGTIKNLSTSGVLAEKQLDDLNEAINQMENTLSERKEHAMNLTR